MKIEISKDGFYVDGHINELIPCLVNSMDHEPKIISLFISALVIHCDNKQVDVIKLISEAQAIFKDA